MRLLLDSHIFLWAVGMPERLQDDERSLLLDSRNELFLSVASVWEIAIKQSLGRLTYPLADLDLDFQTLGLQPLPILPDHAVQAAILPRHHGDPFDRMLIAQARIEGLLIISHDKLLRQYEAVFIGSGH